MAILNNILSKTLFIVFVFFLSVAASAQQRPLSEDALLALYTFNFAKFTEWPVTSFQTHDASFNLCVLGENPFGIAAARIEGKPIKSHKLNLKHFPRVAVLKDCHLLFISRSEEWRLDAILQALNAAPILTVSNIPDFANRGGMIELEKVEQRILFTINPAAVERSDLRISSKLLELARIIGKS